jgi:hypothetical protein
MKFCQWDQQCSFPNWIVWVTFNRNLLAMCALMILYRSSEDLCGTFCCRYSMLVTLEWLNSETWTSRISTIYLIYFLTEPFTLFLNIGNLILHEYHVTLDQEHVWSPFHLWRYASSTVLNPQKKAKVFHKVNWLLLLLRACPCPSL